MYSEKNSDDFNFEETKRNVNDYFVNLEKIKWELVKLDTQKGLIAKYDFAANKKQPYVSVGKDEFNLSAIEDREKELKLYIASYDYIKDSLSEEEQLYITERFANRKYEDDVADLLGFNNRDSNGFRQLRRTALYKFADVLNLVVENVRGE